MYLRMNILLRYEKEKHSFWLGWAYLKATLTRDSVFHSATQAAGRAVASADSGCILDSVDAYSK